MSSTGWSEDLILEVEGWKKQKKNKWNSWKVEYESF